MDVTHIQPAEAAKRILQEVGCTRTNTPSAKATDRRHPLPAKFRRQWIFATSGASRGKGLETEYSDFDCTMIVKEDVLKQYKRYYENSTIPEVELIVTTLSQFRDYAAWGRDTSWARYNSAHLSAFIDKTRGEAQRLIDEKGCLPLDAKRPFLAGAIDRFINQTYRSLKCVRDDNTYGARLEAAKSVTPFLNAVLALHDRLRPYYEYIEWELSGWPLQRFALQSGQIHLQLI
jgi:hypothetical protein